jgi:hypothetical protein
MEFFFFGSFSLFTRCLIKIKIVIIKARIIVRSVPTKNEGKVMKNVNLSIYDYILYYEC